MTVYDCGVKFNLMSPVEVVREVSTLSEQGKTGIQITGVNLEQIALLKKNEAFADYVNASDLVNVDGTIVYIYLRLKGYPIKQRTLCADILYEFLKDADLRGDDVYFLGATQESVEAVVSNIQTQYPNIQVVGYHNGYFEDELEVVQDIKSKHPKYLFIGMPSPHKERFITKYKSEMGASICFGVGGMFDIIAGKAERAPFWIQRCGLEWLYRISQNPGGHTKRVLKALPACLWVISRYLFTSKKKPN